MVCCTIWGPQLRSGCGGFSSGRRGLFGSSRPLEKETDEACVPALRFPVQQFREKKGQDMIEKISLGFHDTYIFLSQDYLGS